MHDAEKTHTDDYYNIKNNKENNKKVIEKDLAVDENDKRIGASLKRIGIDYAANTKKDITKIIGEEPQTTVLVELVNKNFAVLAKAKNQSQGYRYGILTKLLQRKYHGLKLKLEAERKEQELAREERKRQTLSRLEDYSRYVPANKTEEGIGDISKLLDDMFEEDHRLSTQSSYDSSKI